MNDVLSSFHHKNGTGKTGEKHDDGEYDPDKLDSLVKYGFELLGKAAESIPSPEDILGQS